MDPQEIAERTLSLMRREGFDDAMVEASRRSLVELNIAHDEPTLMRDTRTDKLVLMGLVEGRRASTELGNLTDAAVRRGVADLLAAARSAPQDAANAVSAGERASIERGPMAPQPLAMADALSELLAWRAEAAPTVMIEEGQLSHRLVESHLFTSAGSSLACRLGWYELTAIASAREGTRSSSINFGGGQFENLTGEPPSLRLGVRAMLADLAQQVHTQSLQTGFVGDVVLTPPAVDNLLDWFRAQLSDLQLIAGTSLYRDRVGELVASPLLSMHSRFDAPGVMPLSSDGFVGAPVTLLREGRLMALVPTLYGSRKTGLAHVPIAGSGWELAAGETPKATLIKSIGRGAVVGRLSMGTPAANGDFSGVIKNSFLVEGGQIGAALSEVMISGNMAQMLRDVVAVSRERLDTGAALLPWVRISGLHFS